MITHASFKNFKSLRDTEIDFERLTVIVGPNASGKTSILEGLDFISQACSHGGDVPNDRLWPRFCTRGTTGDMELQCATADVSITLVAGPQETAARRGLFACDLTKPVKQQEAVSIQRGVTRPLLRVQQALKATALVRLDASRLAAATYSDQIEPKMECDGGGLATVLAYLALNKPDAFKRLQDHLHAVIPAVQGVRFERRPVKRGEAQPAIMGDSLILDFDGAPGVPADMVSQGTLLVLGILTIILGPETPRLLLLDDIEHGLHPKAQRDLLQLLQKLLTALPDLQIIATSHSPYLLDGLDPKEVRITYAAEGVSYCAPLMAHPDFDRWKDEMLPGEFWSAVGEDWTKDVPARGAK